jgi:hypothetical protein
VELLSETVELDVVALGILVDTDLASVVGGRVVERANPLVRHVSPLSVSCLKCLPEEPV